MRTWMWVLVAGLIAFGLPAGPAIAAEGGHDAPAVKKAPEPDFTSDEAYRIYQEAKKLAEKGSKEDAAALMEKAMRIERESRAKKPRAEAERPVRREADAERARGEGERPRVVEKARGEEPALREEIAQLREEVRRLQRQIAELTALVRRAVGERGEGERADRPREGADRPREGADRPREGADRPREGADRPREGADRPREGADRPREGERERPDRPREGERDRKEGEAPDRK